ncbi:hypothetical protein [Klebsiella quasipneumoniae]|uniref:hypothetical protein n=1 Tax=Klebsiella quasipneumoniae TaxID=1463165 RepID=UPI000C7B23B0|nr:hypothetical protein [Klebsiella quasipneumoniae]PLJ29894.1 hypothetical protein B6J62_19050 [Klebsiella quasipneumoniae]
MTRPRHVLDAVLDGVADPAAMPEPARKRLDPIRLGEPPVRRLTREELDALRQEMQKAGARMKARLRARDAARNAAT